jgi:hypothetical protein
MLDLLGRKADGWIAPLATGYETKPGAQDRIDAAARAAGRDPAGIRRAIQLFGTVTDVPYTTNRPRSGPGGQPIRTTPDIWAKIITEFAAEQRFDTVNLIPEQDTGEQFRLFAAEVIPLARAAVTVADAELPSLPGPASACRPGDDHADCPRETVYLVAESLDAGTGRPQGMSILIPQEGSWYVRFTGTEPDFRLRE